MVPCTVSTLDNGLRIVSRRCQANSEYLGIVVNAGSRDDGTDRYGLAHLVEHTIFKGTTRRSASHILNRMESVGGELNAYTTKEETVVYSVFPRGYASRAAQLICDLIENSQFPDREVSKEKDVVREEILSYLDNPADSVLDDFEDKIFTGSGLGHNILGTEQSVMSLTADDCRDFLNHNFTPRRMVVFYDGHLSHNSVCDMMQRYCASLHRPDTEVVRPAPHPVEHFDLRSNLDSHQAHTVTGTRLSIDNDIDRAAYSLLTNIVGGPGMNSQLNVDLREKRGLVYTVDAQLTTFGGTGLFSIYFGCDTDDVEHCRRRIARTMNLLPGWLTTARHMDKAVRQMVGQLSVSADSRETTIIAAARDTLLRGTPRTLRQRIDTLQSVSAARAAELAEALRYDNLSTLTYG